MKTLLLITLILSGCSTTKKQASFSCHSGKLKSLNKKAILCNDNGKKSVFVRGNSFLLVKENTYQIPITLYMQFKNSRNKQELLPYVLEGARTALNEGYGGIPTTGTIQDID
jgi:hypothetical protein